MPEPVSTSSLATPLLMSATFVGLWSGADAGVVIGAFAGAVVFVLSAAEFPIWKRLLFFIVSFVMGILGAGFTASIIDAFLPDQVVVDKSIGASVAAASVISLLLFIISKAKNPPTLNLKGGGK